jgi:hypothetical protein
MVLVQLIAEGVSTGLGIAIESLPRLCFVLGFCPSRSAIVRKSHITLPTRLVHHATGFEKLFHRSDLPVYAGISRAPGKLQEPTVQFLLYRGRQSRRRRWDTRD